MFAAHPAHNRFNDLTGQRFGRLIALGYEGGKYHNWLCQCDCGNTKSVASGELRRGNVQSCGCFRRDTMRDARLIDLTGQRFARLVALRHVGGGQWLCKCDCGKEHITNSVRLKNGSCQSCGCLIAEGLVERSTTHGMRNTPEYRTWTQIKQRCHNPKNKDYDRYGGRGIVVCERWRHRFENFFADMGKRPSDEHSIDRIDNDGPYSPENCQWATGKQQARNRQTNRLIDFDGKTMTTADWAEHLGIERHIIENRIVKGWSVERALTVPSRPRAK